MREQIRLLERLQEIDYQIDHHEKEMSRLPLEIQEIARSLVVLRRETSEAQEKIAALEKDYRRKEVDLSTEQEKIKKSERRLLSIKNQKEYNALSREVKLGKKVAGEIEDSILALMAEIESLKKTLDRKENEYQESEQNLLNKKDESEAVTKEAKSALVGLNSEKEEITSSVDRDFLKRYQIVKKARGTALAELQKRFLHRMPYCNTAAAQHTSFEAGRNDHVPQLPSNIVRETGKYSCIEQAGFVV